LELAEQIISKIHLKEVENNLACEISYGQQKLLTLGCCLANDADFLLLDEPVAGIDRENCSRIYNLIIQLKKEGKTILQIEHNHSFVESLSDTILFLNSGIAFAFDSYKAFITDCMVKETYLN
jgi:branched-chain amino acid transport system ATP-binding protein